MSQLPHKPLSEEVMSFLEQIENSFQDAEVFLQESKAFLSQEGYGQELAETIRHVQKAKQYVSNLRQQLPSQIDERENAIIDALKKTRANRRR